MICKKKSQYCKKLQYFRKDLWFLEKSCNIVKKVVVCRKKLWLNEKNSDL